MKQRQSIVVLACALCVFGGLQPGRAIAATSEVAGDPMTRDDLFEPAEPVGLAVKNSPAAMRVAGSVERGWSLRGGSARQVSVVFGPPDAAWDFSGHSLFRLTMRNDGPGTLFVTARLDNPGAVDWAKSSRSQAYILPGEVGQLTIAYPRPWDADDSPEAFQPASAKPNGWRSHWKSFDPSRVVACRLVIRSSEPEIKLDAIRAHLAWPFGAEANQALLALPHVDRFGQSIPMTWPSKVTHETQLEEHARAEAGTLNRATGPAAFNGFGGYRLGPQREATGYFRAEKIDGTWWLVDPTGRLFWSNGVCTVGNRVASPLTKRRRALFAALPEPGTA
ncbi:MAG: hypothetical protein ACPGYV_03255, partial [Phycisphaeraceae bacterium]